MLSPRAAAAPILTLIKSFLRNPACAHTFLRKAKHNSAPVDNFQGGVCSAADAMQLAEQINKTN
jgi:hypothetical protein